MANDGAGQPGSRGRRNGTTSWLTAVLAGVGLLVGLVILAFGSRWLAAQAAPVLFLYADGDHLVLIAYLLTLWGSVPLLGLLAGWVRNRFGRAWSVPVWSLVGLLAVLLFGFVPGRNSNGSLSRDLSRVSGGTLTNTGDVFIWSALAGVIVIIVVAPLVGGWVFADQRRLRTRPGRLVPGALAYVGAWVGAGALVLARVGDTPPRISWLEETAQALQGPGGGVTDRFQVGLVTSRAEVVDCDTAAAALRLEGEVPQLDGCRRALLVVATGRYGPDSQPQESGELIGVVLQARTRDEVAELDRDLDEVELVEAAGLPQSPGDVLVTEVPAAYSLVIAAEDTADIPLPEEGPGTRPLTRALAYVVTGTALGLYVSPPEETPALASRR